MISLLLLIATSIPSMGYQHAFDADFYNVFRGLSSLRYSWQSSATEALSVQFNHWQYDRKEISGSSFSTGIGYRFYHQEDFAGLYYGLGADLHLASARSQSSESRDALLYGLYYEGGYSFPFQGQATMNFNLTAYYLSGQFRDLNFPFLGLTFVPRMFISWRL